MQAAVYISITNNYEKQSKIQLHRRGHRGQDTYIKPPSTVIDNLDTANTLMPLSAHIGKLLAERVVELKTLLHLFSPDFYAYKHGRRNNANGAGTGWYER